MTAKLPSSWSDLLGKEQTPSGSTSLVISVVCKDKQVYPRCQKTTETSIGVPQQACGESSTNIWSSVTRTRQSSNSTWKIWFSLSFLICIASFFHVLCNASFSALHEPSFPRQRTLASPGPLRFLLAGYVLSLLQSWVLWRGWNSANLW